MDTKRKLVATLAIVAFALAACDDASSPTSPPAPLPASAAPADGASLPAGDEELDATEPEDLASPAE